MAYRRPSREFDSSDGFDQLQMTLPKCESLDAIEEADVPLQVIEDDFQQWQIDRYNRTSDFNIRVIIESAFKSVHSNYILSILSYVLYLVTIFSAFHFQFRVIFIIVDSIGALVSTSMCFSLIANEGRFSRIKLLFSVQGFYSLIIQMCRSLATWIFFMGFKEKNEKWLIRLLIVVCVRIPTFYHSCFIFESINLNFFETLSFSFKTFFCEIPLIYSFAVLNLCIVLYIIGPFTLGITTWIAISLKCFAFLNTCGSRKSTLDIS